MLAVGEHQWGEVSDETMKISCALAGGLGCSHEDVCGALSGGVMVIGVIYGRTAADQDDTECNERVCAYRERFVKELGMSRCQDLRDSGFGGDDGRWPCSNLVERAVRQLMVVLGD